MAQHEVYVAFSIHGSNTFITANKKIELAKRPAVKTSITIDGLNFKVGKSRTKSLNNAIKLLANDLMEESKPTSDAKKVLAFFHQLGDLGWNVDDYLFHQKHNTALTDYVRKPLTLAPSMPEQAAAPATDHHPEQTDDPHLPSIVADVPDNLEQSEEKATE